MTQIKEDSQLEAQIDKLKVALKSIKAPYSNRLRDKFIEYANLTRKEEDAYKFAMRETLRFAFNKKERKRKSSGPFCSDKKYNRLMKREETLANAIHEAQK